ncbi:hypothetical protein [Robbsia sp. KACC 23696]|uniref:hypothetical protein n=1 Tax=Robbsia sp. KACC 23696 TaxID=3149231 RepID=UPI00325A72EB
MGKLLSWAAMGAVNVTVGAVWRVFLFVLRQNAIEGADEAPKQPKKAPAKPATITLTSPTASSAVSDQLLSR